MIKTKLESLKEKVQARIQIKKDPLQLYWLEKPDDYQQQDSMCDYCYDCAEKMRDYFYDKTVKPYNYKSWRDHPDWFPSKEGEILISSACGAYLSDSHRLCELCEEELFVELTQEGLQEEISHYQTYGFESQHGFEDHNDWERLIFLLDGAISGNLTKEEDIETIIDIVEKGLSYGCKTSKCSE